MSYIFTSESVSDGHPDKVADQISDALLDEALKNGDETTRVAIETLVTTNHVTVSGEVKNFNVPYINEIIQRTIKDIGYEQKGFHHENLDISRKIHHQSADIGLGTNDFGAGDQGIMFGYACSDNEAYLPAPIYYSHEILKKLKEARHIFTSESVRILEPDAKSQVSVEYEENKVKRVDQVAVSSQHKEGEIENARKICESVARDVLGNLVDNNTIFHLNPTGNFVIGGPDGDTGLTGRKIIVDTYGGYAPHGGGAFSGKDPTKVDRSATYMARWLAKKVVAHSMADWCQIQLSYAIGIKEPTSVYIKSNGDDKAIHKYILDNIDLTPKGIIDRFDLFNFTQYKENSVFGHFGNKDVPWEKI